MPQPVYRWFPEHRRAWQAWVLLQTMSRAVRHDWKRPPPGIAQGQILAEGCVAYHRGDCVKALRFLGHARVLVRQSLRKSFRFIPSEGLVLNHIDHTIRWVKAGKFSGENPEAVGASEAGGSTPPLASNLLPASKSQARRLTIQTGVHVPYPPRR